MYEEYFGLSGAPFKLNPDPKFFFGSRSHNKAMAYLHYGVKQAEGFIVSTGPVGSGKSMLIGHLLDQLNRSNVIAAHLLTSNVEPGELLGHVLSAFRIEPENKGRTGELEAFEDYLFDQLNRGRRVLLIMDEAQNLPHKTLEELRMLSNIDYDGTPLFQVFLVGQPEFRETIESKELEQLRQRVIASYHLENLSQEETREYILHRLSVVGWREDPVFTDGAFNEIYKETEGLPRRINTLCNRVMLYCAMEKAHEATANIVETVIKELREEKLGRKDVTKEKLPPVRPVARKKPEPKESNGHIAKAVAKATKEKETREKPSTKTPKAKAAEEKPMPIKEPEKPKLVDAPASASVFDRLRAMKQSPPADIEDEDEAPPQPATLEDVATAIATASSGKKTEAESAPEGGMPEEEKALLQELTAAAPELAAGKGEGPEWRKSVISSIHDTRDELKEAHASVLRLRKTMSEIDARRDGNRARIVASLSRAETLLNELRDAWR
jgi:general secretion pathway protein A